MLHTVFQCLCFTGLKKIFKSILPYMQIMAILVMLPVWVLLPPSLEALYKIWLQLDK